ncbi:MAG TPA: squalene/phytoene synthase family protein [Ktedonobacteraceae bacterium]|nr:squalene/phytoene synthase family protein [Ktedonobacteraceae bacterium]
MRQEQVLDAFEYCRRVTQHASKTFYWGSIFLPPPKRRAIWAIYAFCRLVDDAIDEATGVRTPHSGHYEGSSTPLQVLDKWRAMLEHLYRQGTLYGPRDVVSDPVQIAWYEMLQKYPVPLQPALDLLDGVEMDLTIRRYQNFEDLRLYCYRVAGTVGLLTSAIFGYRDDKALTHAVDLGIALQLTNILRDVGEDARRGRIYIPLEEMTRFGYTEENLMASVINDPFQELIHFQMARAEDYYLRAQPGIAMLDEDCRFAVRLSSNLYRRILDRIRMNHYNVFTMRASLPLQTKLRIVSTQWFLQQLAFYRSNHR